ncbi:hypothetical protein ACT3SZ_14850 [Corynebacterium sp. AOP40-9SA-29]|uniref:hypothetical protein n=1 Tax=Corynebacterium sp. AOP40-9SA-29 TaxID=3457677 RepID=UPI004034C653
MIDILAAAATDAPHILAQFDVNTVNPPAADRFSSLLGILKWFCIAAGVAALMLAGAMFGYEKFFAHGEVQSPKKIAAAVAGGIVASSAGAIMQFGWGVS